MFQIASLKIIWTDSTEIFFSKLRSAGLNYHFGAYLKYAKSFFKHACAAI